MDGQSGGVRDRTPPRRRHGNGDAPTERVRRTRCTVPRGRLSSGGRDPRRPGRTQPARVLARYSQEAQRYGHGRLINNAVHDACYHGVLNGARDIDRDNIHVDVVTVFRRGNDALHTNWRRQDGQWIRQPQAAKTIRHERSRSWSPQETAVFASAMARLRSVMGPTWTSQLDEIEDLARPLQSQEPPQDAPSKNSDHPGADRSRRAAGTGNGLTTTPCLPP